MLKFNPHNRITAQQALKSKIFDSIRAGKFEQPNKKKLVIEGYLEESFDYDNFRAPKYDSITSVKRILCHEVRSIKKISALFQS